jgi:hypothetical protein
MSIAELRQEISEFLRFSISDAPVAYVTHEAVEEDGYRRLRISYPSEEGDQIPAFLLLPMAKAHLARCLSIINITVKGILARVKFVVWLVILCRHSAQRWLNKGCCPGTRLHLF